MNHKINFIKWLIIGVIFIVSSNTLLGSESDMNELVLYLADHDIIMTQNTSDNQIYEGYDYNSKATYKITVTESGKINDFSIEMAGTTYEKLDFDKLLALKWFTNHYLEKNEDFFKDVKNNMRDISFHHSVELDLGEWKLNLLIFPLSNGDMDISLHFIEDAIKGSKKNNQSTLSSLKDIYKELACIERNDMKKSSEKLSYKLPYYKLNPNESIYYHSFINKNNIVYKTQFIFYKNGFEFDYKSIPQLKQIITLVTDKKSYPLDKLNLQFKHLKEYLLNKPNEHTTRSSWDYQGIRSVMDVERYAVRNQCRIKITVYLVKK